VTDRRKGLLRRVFPCWNYSSLSSSREYCSLFREARQNAVAQNITVEGRIYDLPAQSGSPPVYAALQLHWLKADGTTPPVNKPLFLPASVVIDATPNILP
jgi:hypothetical protein